MIAAETLSQEESLLNQSEVHEDIMDECHLNGNEEELGHQIFDFVKIT